MNATITIEISPGASIESAARDATRVANQLGIDCVFDFNDVRCVAIPNGSPELLAKRQQYEQGRKLTHPYDYRRATSDWRPRDSDRSGEAIETTKIGSTEGESAGGEAASPKESGQ